MFQAILLAATTIVATTVAPRVAPPIRMEIVTFAGQRYRFPASEPAHIKRFADSFEVGLPIPFWNKIFSSVAPLRQWQIPRWGGSVLIYVTKPSESFQWTKRKSLQEPPVKESIMRESTRGSMTLWASRGIHGQQDIVYITYTGNEDIYVSCDRIAVDDWTAGCDLFWFDQGALHVLGIVGDWLEKAPTVAAEYQRTVKIR